MSREALTSTHGSEMYRNLLDHIREKAEAVGREEQISIVETVTVARNLISEYDRCEELLEVTSGYYDPLDFAISHAANVAIYSLRLARGMGLSETEVEDTVIAGLLHDIGFSRIPVYSRDEEEFLQYEDDPDRAMSEEDFKLVLMHSRFGHDAILPEDDRAELIADIILQHHEKADGSGYPDGLRESDQLIPARIISIIDTYEALIHPRPFRDALVPPQGFEAIKAQVNGAYSVGMIKELLRAFSIYPVGHFVRLSNGSIGRVIETHREYPFRPVITLLFDPRGERIDPPRRIDLAEEQMLSVSECLPRYRQQ